MKNESIAKSRVFRGTYLPGGVVSLRNGSFGKIIGVRDNSAEREHIDRTQLLNVVRGYVFAWQNMTGAEVSSALLDALNDNSLQLQCPGDVFVSPFPLVLKCSVCETIDFYSRQSEEAILNRMRKRLTHGAPHRVKCRRPTCSGYMVQLRYLSVHRCGSMDHINIPGQVFAVANAAFRDRGNSFITSSFHNLDTDEKITNALSLNCRACQNRFPGGKGIAQRGTPITSGHAFYPQTAQYISLNEKDGELLTEISSYFLPDTTPTGVGMDFAEGIVSGLLGLHDPNVLKKSIRKLLHDGGQDENQVKELQCQIETKQAALQKYENMHDDPMFADILNSVRGDIEDLEEQLANAQGVFSTVRNHISEESFIGEIATDRRAQEAVFLRKAFNEYSITDRLEDETDTQVRESISQQWSELKKSYGIDDILHISDLNVVLAAFGYTREKRSPYTESTDEVPLVLQPFEENLDQSMSGKAIAYAMSAKTEALHIRFDPRKVLKWCSEEFGVSLPDKEILKDKTASHAHLLKECPALTFSPSVAIREMADRPLRESAPFHLMHTVSHCLLSVAKRHTGYDEKSLGEYLFPQDLSMLLYVASVQNYTAGGLLTLFKHYLLPWFNDASNYAFQCVFDPVCSESGCSCNGCVQRVIGCETFNRGVSRAYLYGGETGEDANSQLIQKGFWHGDTSYI
ncbi:MAG: hypothetical protein C0618_04365 [Desulfuromonas sp.]|nr:MAG: hypothetical protein C0618_04365 [Desulfuromonas sp.]